MRLKALLIVTAVAESATGLALLGLPAVVLGVLLGIQAAIEETLVVGRVAGAALLAIGVTSALARDDTGSPALRGVLIGVLVYDALVALLLAYAALALQMTGPALWPAVAVHTLLAGWCIRCLRT
jgi:phosphotransferase system  glucose/maltose/N-acetylglucosamine-specific IIC component